MANRCDSKAYCWREQIVQEVLCGNGSHRDEGVCIKLMCKISSVA